MSMEKLSKDVFMERLKNVELLSLDTDGVLTDGGIYFSDAGEQFRKFNVKDGMGIKLIQSIGVEIIIISSSTTLAIKHRASALGIDRVYLGVEDKKSKIKEICAELALSLNQVVHIGDDLNDIPVLNIVGLSITVADAVEDVIAIANFVTEKKGGEGAVREVCDLIVAAKDA